jgi:hypothetical protein
MEIAYPITLGVLLVFLLIAVLPPKLPLAIRLVLQALLGAIIYFKFHDASFGLPDPDNLPISELFGGWVEEGHFNKLSVGVVFFVLGAVLSVVVAAVRFALRKKADKPVA